MLPKPTYSILLFALLGMSSCQYLPDLVNHPTPSAPKIVPFVENLIAPLGIESDAHGRLWITEAGTGLNSDGQLSLITQQGKVYPVITGFASQVSPEGAVFGLNHLLLKDNILYMLHGVEGRLYKFDISTFTPGNAPLHADQIAYEDIGSFVKAYEFEEDTDETDVFNLTVGPNGDLFIVDAAANAIIRRQSSTGELSIFATIPSIATQSEEIPSVEAVPTGIVFDGQQFLVCTFTGFPFPPKATIYQVDLTGHASVYQTGFSTLTDIELGIDKKPVVLEYGTWTGEGFTSNSGRFLRVTPGTYKELLPGLNFPNSLERSGHKTYFIAQTFDGLIQKITY
jgi:sugar lactone lactonase YvrE